MGPMGSLYRSLTISFGAVVLALMTLFLLVASVLSFRIQETRQDRLATALAYAVEESVNRVNFYQMRELVQRLTDRVPGLGYVAVVDLEGRILAHSNGALVGETLARAGQVDGTIPELLWNGRPFLQIARPLVGGLDHGTIGSILVGLSLADLRQDQAKFLGTLTLLTLGGTLAAMVAVFFLARRFGTQVQSLALQLRGFLDRSPVGLAVVAADGSLVQQSRSFAALVADAGGTGDTFPELMVPLVSAADGEDLRLQAHQVRRDGAVAAGEWRVGSATWHLTQFPLTPRLEGLIVQDLTRRVVAEQELVESRAQLNQIIDRSPVGMAVVELSTGVLLRMNQRLTETYGYTVSDCPDLDEWFARAHPDEGDRNEVRETWARVIESHAAGLRPPSSEVALAASDGSTHWVKVSTALVGTLAVVTFVDQTKEKHAEAALSELNRSLEEKVRERTEELERTYRELADTEKFAALGQLAAGMAHELNTPLGAILAANRINYDFYSQPLRNMVHLVHEMTGDELSFLLELVDRNIVLRESLPPSPPRNRRKAMMAALDTRGLGSDEETAEYVLELGWTEADLDRYRDQPRLWKAVLAARDLLSLARMNAIVTDGATKASHVVDALRRYLVGKDDVEFLPFPVADQLETILTLFRHKIKSSVTVVRRFDPDVTVVGDRQKLNQVWMNLVQNALQAMGSQGTLTLGTRVEARSVVVEVSDTGPGIADAIRDKIFTPYFTTKKPGEGMGLGLDLCRKIVEAHHGTVAFTSAPGKTTFTVTLPG
jgi:PAS domain S-box-containing protein